MSELRRIRRAWYLYDWANSAFAVTILAALFGPYLATVVVPAGGVDVPLLGVRGLSATSLYGYTLAASALLVLLSSPLLGAIADHSGARKRFLAFFAFLGSACSVLFFFIGEGDVVAALLLFFVANFSFVSANVFYDAFLPHIAGPDEQDEVSGRGYAWGYAGGGLLFLLQLALVTQHEAVGITDTSLAVRISLASAGLWWGGFSLITVIGLPETGSASVRIPPAVAVRAGWRRIARTMRHLRSMRQMLLFLLAFMVYNDGIQTVIAMATIYGSEELGFDVVTLMGCLLMVQLVGILGARVFAALASRLGTRHTIIWTLVIWAGVTLYAFVMTQPVEFWILGGIVGLVLGGSQALSRSYYAKMIPAAASAEFFGFFSVFEKFSAIWGPLVFALIRQLAGSSRLAILSLLAFFVIGIIGLLLVREDKARREAVELSQTLTH